MFRAGKFTTYRGNRELEQQKITGLAAAADGTVWVATAKAVFKLDKTGTAREFAAITDPSALFVDRNETLWIGTVAHGVFHFSGEKLIEHSVGPMLDRKST